MKTVFRIFGILAILIALLMCVLCIHRASLDNDEIGPQLAAANAQIAEYKEQANQMGGETKKYLDEQIAAAEAEIKKVPSPATFLTLEGLFAAMILVTLVFGVFLFRPNLKLALPLLGVAVVLFVCAYFVSPDIERGEYGPAESRTLALWAGIPVVIAGLCAFGVATKSAAKKA